MDNKINLALQILPKVQHGDAYTVVDKAIEVIRQSGVVYRVCPFETVMEGTYDELMQVAEKAQQACFDAGAEEILTYMKIQRRKNAAVTIADKMEKYD